MTAPALVHMFLLSNDQNGIVQGASVSFDAATALKAALLEVNTQLEKRAPWPPDIRALVTQFGQLIHSDPDEAAAMYTAEMTALTGVSFQYEQLPLLTKAPPPALLTLHTYRLTEYGSAPDTGRWPEVSRFDAADAARDIQLLILAEIDREDTEEDSDQWSGLYMWRSLLADRPFEALAYFNLTGLAQAFGWTYSYAAMSVRPVAHD